MFPRAAFLPPLHIYGYYSTGRLKLTAARLLAIAAHPLKEGAAQKKERLGAQKRKIRSQSLR
jgi:hypothetical protein